MADIDLTGYWKGLAVAPSVHAVVHVFLEQRGNTLGGQFEAPDLPEMRGFTNKGALRGAINGDQVTFEVADNAAEKVVFTGRVVGEGRLRQMLYGTLQSNRVNVPGGTLTLFQPQHQGIVTQMYSM